MRIEEEEGEVIYVALILPLCDGDGDDIHQKMRARPVDDETAVHHFPYCGI